MSELLLLDRERLQRLAEENCEAYAQADPFPHVVIDDFLPEDVMEAVLAEFPDPQQIQWWTFDDARERKLGTMDDTVMGPVTRQVLAQLNSAATIDFLRNLTGIEGLVPDPHFFGGGLHQIEPGGFLKVHADFNLHPTTRLERRLNLLLYLNKDWQTDYGGALELWNADMTACGHSIEPIFNRCVVFTTSELSYHGHPEPLCCPQGTTRKSIALYYYSAPRMAGGRPIEHNTVFLGRPGEALPQSRASDDRQLSFLRRSALRWLPPVLTEKLRQIYSRGTKAV